MKKDETFRLPYLSIAFRYRADITLGAGQVASMTEEARWIAPITKELNDNRSKELDGWLNENKFNSFYCTDEIMPSNGTLTLPRAHSLSIVASFTWGNNDPSPLFLVERSVEIYFMIYRRFVSLAKEHNFAFTMTVEYVGPAYMNRWRKLWTVTPFLVPPNERNKNENHVLL